LNLSKASKIGKYCSLAAFLGAGTLIISVFILLPVAYFIDLQAIYTITVTLLFSGVIFCFLHYGLAVLVKCPKCQKHLMISWSKHTHENAPYDNGTEVAFHWFKGKVVCIHCGEEVETNGT
jgi:hypothetical protein